MYANIFEEKSDICYFKIIMKVGLISKMLFLMVVLHFCTTLIFHCIEVIRGGGWGILTFSIHMASEISMAGRSAHSVTNLRRYLTSTQMSKAKEIQIRWLLASTEFE